ncbi:hypothetical protein BU23DRAFT_570028 [Bimuria novae-zelandiae CBS 107.79]|uniref:Uncharacterized protein n=1 Tax=Bimuria novae-zelandiae CBS 107.79 TaxID=1447943 RepID=A0A6A5V2B1_9PLEO|nr:hypothetical protein BU23DRAFT_570028 [Bimuria novae-zelandiae CBS 107.79]
MVLLWHGEDLQGADVFIDDFGRAAEVDVECPIAVRGNRDDVILVECLGCDGLDLWSHGEMGFENSGTRSIDWRVQYQVELEDGALQFCGEGCPSTGKPLTKVVLRAYEKWLMGGLDCGNAAGWDDSASNNFFKVSRRTLHRRYYSGLTQFIKNYTITRT